MSVTIDLSYLGNLLMWIGLGLVGCAVLVVFVLFIVNRALKEAIGRGLGW